MEIKKARFIMNLNEIDTTNNGKLPFKRHKWFADTIGGITTGGIYLLWGQAGSGKSTILRSHASLRVPAHV